MLILKDRENNTIGYVANNIILSPEKRAVGIILGSCIFSNKGFLGKFIKTYMYNTNGEILNFRGFDNHAFILRAHVLDEKPNQPPPPVEEIELKRLVEAISVMPPPPPEKKKIPWVIIFLTFVGLFVAWKFWSMRGSLHTQAVRAPGSSH